MTSARTPSVSSPKIKDDPERENVVSGPPAQEVLPSTTVTARPSNNNMTSTVATSSGIHNLQKKGQTTGDEEGRSSGSDRQNIQNHILHIHHLSKGEGTQIVSCDFTNFNHHPSRWLVQKIARPFG